MSEKKFVDECEKIKEKGEGPVEILNWYRNLYYKENLGTERRIVSDALNIILPELVKLRDDKRILFEEIERLRLCDKKCGNCFYSTPYTGQSKTFRSYVECTNAEHLRIYCKHDSSRYRLPTAKACKCYVDRETIRDADEIIEAYEKKNHWISVDDKLPESEERVLVYLSHNRTDPHSSYTQIDTDRLLNGHWVRWGNNVSHWMSLPEAPVGGGNK